MSGKGSPGFSGLIVEGAVIGLVVALLPKLPLGSSAAAPPEEVASQRPSLAPAPIQDESPSPPLKWRTPVIRPEPPLPPPPANPTYVEERLDKASQQLVGGLATFLTQHAEEVLAAPEEQAPARVRPPQRVTPKFTPKNAYRY
jgi:hypothetical protein